MKRRAWFGALLLCCTLPATAAPDREQELAALRSRIEKLRTELEETRGERDTVRDSVRATERRIDGQLTQLRKTRAREADETRKLAALEKSRARAQGDLAKHRAEIDAAVRAAFVLGRQDTLKLLLSQDDPARLSRMLVYARYLTESRVAQMLKLQRTLDELAVIEKQIGERRTQLLTDRHLDEPVEAGGCAQLPGLLVHPGQEVRTDGIDVGVRSRHRHHHVEGHRADDDLEDEDEETEDEDWEE